ncbi:MAG: efflux RND transporter permease subunit [Gammaproteobacteria bacterium]|nr:efflux RND transporter permease subunit [Gammaproteobacteria bacterium]
MWLSDTSVKRPVFATVISLLLVAFGVLSFNYLPLREYPDISPPIVSVSTTYVGASADVIETRITQLIEDQISGIDGVKAIRSSSRDERSSVTIEFDLDRDMEEAANDVRDRVSRVIGRLPEDVEIPIVAKYDSDRRPVMHLNLTSDSMTMMELDDYARRYIVDRFTVIPGVADASVRGGGRQSMRIWLDRLSLAARDLTVTDIESALRRENIELPVGRLESDDREFRLRLARNYQSPEDFRGLVIGTGAQGHPIRLGEVAEVELAPANYRNLYRVNQMTMVGIGISKQSKANTLRTLEGVKLEIARLQASLPKHMQLIASSDESVFIREAINSVFQTILITTALVSVVILLFLGTIRTMLIPAITIPVCLTAAFMALALFDYSVNLITLLALVLSIGLVVDDAIVVLENIHRRIENGEPPLLAAYRGARQVSFAVVATTAVLVAVFMPIIFLQDNMGVIFRELAVAISAAVIFSSVLALSLTPMMCSKLLKQTPRSNVVTQFVDRCFSRLEQAYKNSLAFLLQFSWFAILVLIGMSGFAYWLLASIPEEYAPTEDQGLIFARVSAAEGTGIERMKKEMEKLETPALKLIESGEITRLMVSVPGWGSSSTNSGIMIISLAPWQERDRTTNEIAQALTREWQKVPSLRAFAYSRSGLARGGGGQPVQFVIGGPNYETLAQWRDIILDRAAEYPGLQRVDTDLKETQPQVMVRIDKNRAASLGVSVQNIGRTLGAMMSEQRITTYVQDGEEYDVILQAKRDQRASARDLENIYVRSETSGQLVPLANLIYINETAGAASLNRYNRMRAVTIRGSLTPGYALGDALEFLETIVREELPQIAQIDYKGESLEYKEAAGTLFFTFGLALLIVFLVLAAQFESFVHPFVILLTVPLAVAGGLLGLYVMDLTLNIYSQIGMVMLIGIAAKNGVLIVEFINQLRDAGRDFEEAIIEAAGIRLRPVVMTTIATLMGSIPLIIAVGAGSESRHVLGIVIFSGVSLATFLTLFVVPAFYRLLARKTGSPERVARELDTLAGQRITP